MNSWAIRSILVVSSLSTSWLSLPPAWAAESKIIPSDYTPVASAARRYALVISVENYAHFPRVENALNDGVAIANALLKADYTFVRFLPDPPNVDAIIDRINELTSQASPNSQPVVLTVYYAGHGFQSGGVNYLVPATASSASEKATGDDSLPITTILNKISPGKFGFALVFLDACRTVKKLNDLNRETPLPGQKRAGFVEVPEHEAMVIAMSTGRNSAAQSIGKDNPQNSPYSGALSRNIPVQSANLSTTLENVRSYVLQDTEGTQRPVETNSAGISRFFFKPTQRDREAQDSDWKKLMDGGARRNCLNHYVNLYPAGNYAHSAKYLLSLYPGESNQGEPNCLLF